MEQTLNVLPAPSVLVIFPNSVSVAQLVSGIGCFAQFGSLLQSKITANRKSLKASSERSSALWSSTETKGEDTMNKIHCFYKSLLVLNHSIRRWTGWVSRPSLGVLV